MLTYSSNVKPIRKDRPWLLFLTAIIWIGGATFFHAPWEPFEPYVVAIVKSVLATNSWLIPYLSVKAPYLELQPFYFWLFALIIKIFGFSDITNAVRLINAVLIWIFIALMGRIGSNLQAFKNGRSVVMILISSVGFINNAYQLSPNLVVLLGFALYIYALQQSSQRPGISAWMLSIGLVLISIHFTGEFILIALLLLAILPIISRRWRNREFAICVITALVLFTTIFSSYIWQLNNVDHTFFLEWKDRYLSFIDFKSHNYWGNLVFYLHTLVWYLVPSWFLCGWTIYKRRKNLFKDSVLQISVILVLLLFMCAIFSNQQDESTIFPILIPFILIASVEIDSIKISIVSLLNWFCLFTFGLAGLAIGVLYVALNIGHPDELFNLAKSYAPNYTYQFNFWQLALAILMCLIWIFLITRKHIRGREMVTNWASGTTFVLVMFISLCLPWFNAVLSFQGIVGESMPFIKNNAGCVATNQANRIQNAVWYYYADVTLVPEVNFAQGKCNQALIAVDDKQNISIPNWKIVWSGKRPVDFRRYVLLERESSN